MQDNEIDQEIETLLQVSYADGKKQYAKAQFNLGYLYKNQKKDIVNAEKHYSLVLKTDSPEQYAKAQFNLGYLYQNEENDIEKAEKFYSNVLQDQPIIYAKAQLRIADIYFFHNEKPEKSIKYYSNVEYYHSDESFKYYICSQVMLDHIKNYNQMIFKDEKHRDTIIVDKITKIRKLAVEIQQQLVISFELYDHKIEKHPERRVAHYTKPAVLFYLLKGQDNLAPTRFRLNVVDFMNDPSENKVLASWLGITSYPNHEIKSFLASFSFNHNSLNQFRLYGNEDDILGSGVSIAFNQAFFCSDTERSINADGINKLNNELTSIIIDKSELEEKVQIKNTFKLPLFRCLYFNPDSEYIALAKRNKQSFYLEFKDEGKEPKDIEDEWNKYIKALNEEEKVEIIRTKLHTIKDTVNKLVKNVTLSELTNLQQLITLALMPISCLIKHAAFEDEDECRIIYTTHIADDKIQAPQQYQSANSLFIEYATIEPYIDNIYLGPQCQAHHHLWLTNHITKTTNKTDIKVIKSTMPLR